MARDNKKHPETTISNEYSSEPKDAWEFLNPENYQSSSIPMDDLEYERIRVHGVELYEGIDNKEFAVMECTYIHDDECPEDVTLQRFSLRTGAQAFVKLARDIAAARAAKVNLPPVPLEVVKKGRAWKFEKCADVPFEEHGKQGEIPF